MKSLVRFKYSMLIICLLLTSNLFGKIVNGYTPKIHENRESLKRLKLSEEKDLSSNERHTIKSEIANLTDYISWYELTDALLQQLKTISPSMYHEIDKIKDRKGRNTDVYVKLIPREKAKIQLQALSFLWQSPQDVDRPISEYGEYSASVEICISNNALFLLSHELGHVNYIIPNLADYTIFYRQAYSKQSNISNIGHNHHDRSGKYAEIFVRRFYADRKDYLQNGNEKPPSALALINQIRRDLKNPLEYQTQLAKRQRDIRDAPVQIATRRKKTR